MNCFKTCIRERSIPNWLIYYKLDTKFCFLRLSIYGIFVEQGRYCRAESGVVILALVSITSSVPCTCAAALTIQVLGHYAKAVTRWAWCMFINLFDLVCSVAERNH